LKAVLNPKVQTEDGTQNTLAKQVTEFTFTKKDAENNKQIRSSESVKKLTLTQKITACPSMICRFDCLTNLFLDPDPSLFCLYSRYQLVYGFIE
jgi:hypothetical protein